MTGPEKIGSLSRGTKRFDKEVQQKIRLGEADTNTDAQRQMMRDWFTIDRERDMRDIKQLMSNIANPIFPSWRGVGQPHLDLRTTPTEQGHPRHKYTANQIRERRWDAHDEEFVGGELRSQRIGDVYAPIEHEFDYTDEIGRSLIRLDQLTAIVGDIEARHPVLIRGLFEIGKTSTINALCSGELADRATLRIDMRTFGRHDDDETLNQIGASEVKDYFLKAEGAEYPSPAYQSKGKSIEQGLTSYYEKGRTALEYLNDKLKEKDEEAVVFLDEFTANYGFDKERTNEYLRNIRHLSQLRPVYVIHWHPKYNAQIAAEFSDAHQYFLRPLTIDETTTIIRTPLLNTLFEFTDDAISKVQELSGGWPGSIKEICQQVLMRDEKASHQKFVYTSDDVEATASQILENSVSRDNMRVRTLQGIIQSNSQYYHVFQRLIKEVAIEVEGADIAILEDLAQAGVAEKVKDKTYRIRGEMVKKGSYSIHAGKLTL